MPARRLPLVLLFGIATAFGLSSTVQSYFLAIVAVGRPPDMVGHLVILNLVYWYVPALFAPVIVGLATKFQFARGQGWKPFAVHIAGASVYSVIHSASMLGTRILLMQQHRPSRGWWVAGRVEYLTQLDWILMTYLFLIGIAHALEYRRESERRAVDSARLETRLIEAQLQSLQRQLQPHFLFNTMNAISGLMHIDVEAADRMMDRLGGLLRMALESSQVQEVPLKDELEMLQKYVDIEQVRFGPRLQVTVCIEPDALDAMVPNFLLQPLVENAVRHGVAPHMRQGRVHVEGKREGDRLVLSVTDSGDGVPPSHLTEMNQGVGLTNTGARLEHLYGARHVFAFSNDQGFRVTIEIPYTSDGDAADPVKAGAA